ncbi:MAG: hypothetical protein AAGF85_13980 [Bacteroidota bacterium]
MHNSKGITGAVLLIFTMLWLPLGQHDFLIAHWMNIGTYAVPFMLIGVFLFNSPVRFGTLLEVPKYT